MNEADLMAAIVEECRPLAGMNLELARLYERLDRTRAEAAAFRAHERAHGWQAGPGCTVCDEIEAAHKLKFSPGVRFVR